MASSARWDPYELEQEELRRYGLERDHRGDHHYELELADRIAEQASLASGDWLARSAARHRLGRGPSPYEQPHDRGQGRFTAGERVVHHGRDGDLRRGRVVGTHDHEGLVEVDFGRLGISVVDGDQLEREAA